MKYIKLLLFSFLFIQSCYGSDRAHCVKILGKIIKYHELIKNSNIFDGSIKKTKYQKYEAKFKSNSYLFETSHCNQFETLEERYKTIKYYYTGHF